MSLAALILACASCGSGGDSPLILYPNEPYKLYLGEMRQLGIETVYPDGEIGRDTGPQRKQVLTAAAGMTFGTDAFATVTVPQVTNLRGDEHRTGLGDWVVEGRWTALPASMLTPLKPQIQMITGYKAGNARSIHESEQVHQLDVLGSGFAEYKLGVDFWWGAEAFKFGFAEVLGFARPKSHLGMDMNPGHMSRSTLTAGYGGTMGKVMLGTNLLARQKRHLEGEEVADSETVDHGLFLSGDLMVVGTNSVRLTLAQSSAYGQNRNTFRARSATLAVMGAL